MFEKDLHVRFFQHREKRFFSIAGFEAHQLADAVAKGGTIVTGGTVETLDGGLYLRPTVLTGVTPDMALMAEETFGPVIPVTIFDTIDEAVALANSGEFGLSAAVLAATPEDVVFWESGVDDLADSTDAQTFVSRADGKPRVSSLASQSSNFRAISVRKAL